VERKAKDGGLAEGLLDPGRGVGPRMREGEKVEKEGAGRGLLEIRAEGGGEAPEVVLRPAFESGVGREEFEAGTARHGAGGGEAGGDALPGRGPVDGPQEGRAPRGTGTDEGRGDGRGLGVVAQEDREGKGGDMEGGEHGGRCAPVFDFGGSIFDLRRRCFGAWRLGLEVYLGIGAWSFIERTALCSGGFGEVAITIAGGG